MPNTSARVTPESLTLYIRPFCGFCTRVLRALDDMKLAEAIKQENISTNFDAYEELVRDGGKSQVPALKIHPTGQPPEWLYESLDIINFIRTNLSAD